MMAAQVPALISKINAFLNSLSIAGVRKSLCLAPGLATRSLPARSDSVFSSLPGGP